MNTYHNNNTIVYCPICNEEGRLIHKGTRDDPNIDVYECRECKTKFLSILNDKDYENGFNLNDVNVLTDEDIQNWISKCEKDDIRRSKMVESICINKEILDFGCGYGGYLNKQEKIASLVEGVELSKSEREYINSHGIRCYKDISETNKKYDVITLFHVFEHLFEPEKWLNKFAEYVSDEGYLIIEVPNANDALLSIYENNIFSDFTYWSAHLILYTEESIRILINSSEFWEVERIDQIQRYSLANHLLWLAKGEPGGDSKWDFFSTKQLNDEYSAILKEKKACDTIVVWARKK